MAKKPWFKWYPTNWRADAELRLCSLAARGLWIDLLGYMHEANPGGYLLVNGEQPSPEEIAQLVGAPKSAVVSALAELEKRGVFSIDDEGRIYSRRMLRDIEKARLSSEFGKLGGNPTLKGGDNPTLFPRDQKPEARGKSKGQELGVEGSTPSAPKATRAHRLPIGWELPPEWAAWARQERPEWDEAAVLRVSLKFRDYWLGCGKPRVDWLATWRNWVRQEKAAPMGPRGSLTQAGQRTAEAAERWLGRTGTDDREGER